MLSAIYPSNNPDGSVKETPYANGHMPEEIWDYYPYLTREGEPMRDPATGRALVRADFSPKGYRVADESVRSEGLELDLYYNPTKNVSLFLGYAYLETVGFRVCARYFRRAAYSWDIRSQFKLNGKI